ncbi:hypothetical protein O6H91_03G037100 [Diphasiastrum complanatum]|uniref:Uncharacterized protein n=1 Tax=Diphasiastrum complanatum TaxID=34168 RepID=A0ACC2E5P3_DIPCM|nr:hypothetical protein O6H91_Y188600 [Diphasiastrum complanatum]KAJ7299632.1 hypothetical protein O6H91_Y188600 [Diphasiastrum complanatum]KAJ7561670.1 hypothetical protein O6H91_03G037100 [Diphasiastrum complanatum]
MPQNIYNRLQFDGYPNPTSNSVKQSILSEKSEGRPDLENSPDSVLWMQENGGWMLKFCSETKSVEASKGSRNRKRNRVQALNSKEPRLTSGCSEETKLEKDGRIDTPVDFLGQLTLGGQIRKLKKIKCLPAEEAVNMFIHAQVKNNCDTGSVKNEIFESNNASAVIKVESRRFPFLTEMEVTNSAVADENPALLKRDSSNNMPHLDIQTLFGNGKTKTKSQKKQKRPVEVLESTCQMKEDGSNYRPLLSSRTLFYYGMKKIKSHKKWKRPAKSLENTCQLKEDGGNYRPRFDSQTLFAYGTTKIKSQKKWERPSKALENTCQLKEDGSNYRPLLDTQTLFVNGTKKTKSQKKQKTPAEALESTCQLKEDGSNYAPLLGSQTVFGNGLKKKSQKKWKTPVKAMESTCQLKEDGSNYKPLLDSQTLFGNGTKKTKSQKQKTPTEALESTCQLKEDASKYRPLLHSQTLILSGNGNKKRKSWKKRKRHTGASKSTCQLKEDSSNYRPLLDSQTLSGNGMKKTKSQKKWRKPAEALESTCRRMNIEGVTRAEPHTLTKVSSFPSKRYTERANAASTFYEATDSGAVGYSDFCANKQATNRKRKKSKKKMNPDVRKPDVCCEHLTIESTCKCTFGENTYPKVACSVTKDKQSKVERKRSLYCALRRMSFIKFPKLVSTMAFPIRRHKRKLSKALKEAPFTPGNTSCHD